MTAEWLYHSWQAALPYLTMEKIKLAVNEVRPLWCTMYIMVSSFCSSQQLAAVLNKHISVAHGTETKPKCKPSFKTWGAFKQRELILSLQTRNNLALRYNCMPPLLTSKRPSLVNNSDQSVAPQTKEPTAVSHVHGIVFYIQKRNWDIPSIYSKGKRL